jgi:hypothetical protein
MAAGRAYDRDGMLHFYDMKLKLLVFPHPAGVLGGPASIHIRPAERRIAPELDFPATVRTDPQRATRQRDPLSKPIRLTTRTGTSVCPARYAAKRF